MSRAKSVRRITASKKSKINELVEIIKEFLPLTSPSKKTTTFQTIFKESRVHSYISKTDNKTIALQEGFENLYKYRERLIFGILRKVIPAAIDYRKFKRNPLRKSEIDSLVKVLKKLGIDMSTELNNVDLDESLSRIQIPPQELTRRLKAHDLCPQISSEPLDLFADGYLNEAVRKAAERYETKVQDISGDTGIGANLMGRIFSNVTYLNTDRIDTNNIASFNEGFKFLSMGSIQSIRNIFSHRDEDKRTPEECFEMLFFINWLFRYLKE